MGTSFQIDGTTYTLAEMLDANGHGEPCGVVCADVCAWLIAAKVGDVSDDYHGERIECVPAQLRTPGEISQYLRSGS